MPKCHPTAPDVGLSPVATSLEHRGHHPHHHRGSIYLRAAANLRHAVARSDVSVGVGMTPPANAAFDATAARSASRRSPRPAGRANGHVGIPSRLPIDEVPTPEYYLEL